MLDNPSKIPCQGCVNPQIDLPQYAIYQSSIDYQTAAYGPYAASATGGNDLARDVLAGIAAMYSVPMYTNIPGRPLEYASTILGCLALLVTIPIYIVYWKGPEIREKSKFAQSLERGWEERREKRRKSSLVGMRMGPGDGLKAEEGIIEKEKV